MLISGPEDIHLQQVSRQSDATPHRMLESQNTLLISFLKFRCNWKAASLTDFYGRLLSPLGWSLDKLFFFLKEPMMHECIGGSGGGMCVCVFSS